MLNWKSELEPENTVDELTSQIISTIHSFYYPDESNFKMDGDKFFCILVALEQVKAGILSITLESLGLPESSEEDDSGTEQ